MLLNEMIARSVVRRIFGSSRNGRLLVRESTIRQALSLLVEMAVSKAVEGFIDERVGADFGGPDPEAWLASEERELWKQALDVLDAGTGGKGQEILHALRLLHTKRAKQPNGNFVLPDANLIARVAKNMQGIKARSANKYTSLESIKSVEEMQDVFSMYVEAPGFELTVPNPLTTIDGERSWSIYLPLNPGESCAIAKMGDPNVTWCTARDHNNMFYGYAKHPVWLYYVVEDGNPINKYSIGVDGKTKEIMPSQANHTTVDPRNKAFKFKDAFGADESSVIGFIRNDASSREGSDHPAFKEIIHAARSIESWRTFMKKQSSDGDYLYTMLQHIRDIESAHPEVLANLFAAIVRKNSPSMLQYKYNLNDFFRKNHSKNEYLIAEIDNLAKAGNDYAVELMNWSKFAGKVSETFERWFELKESILAEPRTFADILIEWGNYGTDRNISEETHNDILLTLLDSPHLLGDPAINLSMTIHRMFSRHKQMYDPKRVNDWLVRFLRENIKASQLNPNHRSLVNTIIESYVKRMNVEQRSEIMRLSMMLKPKSKNSFEIENPFKIKKPSHAVQFLAQTFHDNPQDKAEFTERMKQAMKSLKALNGDAGPGFARWVKEQGPLIFGSGFRDMTTHLREDGALGQRWLASMSMEQRFRLKTGLHALAQSEKASSLRLNKVGANLDLGSVLREFVQTMADGSSGAESEGRRMLRSLLQMMVDSQHPGSGFRFNNDMSNFHELNLKSIELEFLMNKMGTYVEIIDKTAKNRRNEINPYWAGETTSLRIDPWLIDRVEVFYREWKRIFPSMLDHKQRTKKMETDAKKLKKAQRMTAAQAAAAVQQESRFRKPVITESALRRVMARIMTARF